MQLFEQQFKCLILWYFTFSELQTNMDMICQKWYLYQACSVTELHITEGADLHRLIHSLKNGSKSKIKK